GLNLCFGGEAAILSQAAEARSLHQHHVDVFGRTGNEALEERPLAAMATQIAAVEEPLARSLDRQGVGVKGGVIDEVWRDGEGADAEWAAIAKVRRRFDGRHVANEEGRRIENALRRLADVDGESVMSVGQQAPMVAMAMRDHHAEKRR